MGEGGAYLLASLMIAMDIRIFLIRAMSKMSRIRNKRVQRIPAVKGREFIPLSLYTHTHTHVPTHTWMLIRGGSRVLRMVGL